jgi:hypothetical protein
VALGAAAASVVAVVFDAAGLAALAAGEAFALAAAATVGAAAGLAADFLAVGFAAGLADVADGPAATAGAWAAEAAGVFLAMGKSV